MKRPLAGLEPIWRALDNSLNVYKRKLFETVHGNYPASALATQKQRLWLEETTSICSLGPLLYKTTAAFYLRETRMRDNAL